MQGKANVSIGLTLFSVLAKPDLLGNKTVETDKSLTNTCSRLWDYSYILSLRLTSLDAQSNNFQELWHLSLQAPQTKDLIG